MFASLWSSRNMSRAGVVQAQQVSDREARVALEGKVHEPVGV
jgi:hypothetical protein